MDCVAYARHCLGSKNKTERQRQILRVEQSWVWRPNLCGTFRDSLPLSSARPGPLLRSRRRPGGGGIREGGSGSDGVPGRPFFFFPTPRPPRPCSPRCARSASATGCRAHARCARAGCGCPLCAQWATCCGTASTVPRASSTATAATTVHRGRNCCAWSRRTRLTSLPRPTTSSTSRNRLTSARTADAWAQQARQGAPVTARRPRWTAASCSAAAGATARARSASPSAATAPSTGAATSAAATARTRAYCTSACEALRGLGPWEHSLQAHPQIHHWHLRPGSAPTPSLQPHSGIPTTYPIISPTSSDLGTPETTCLGRNEPSGHPD